MPYMYEWKNRAEELNSRLAQILSEKGVSATANETTTALINKVKEIKMTGDTDVIEEVNSFLERITSGEYPAPTGLDTERMSVVETSLNETSEALSNKGVEIQEPFGIENIPQAVAEISVADYDETKTWIERTLSGDYDIPDGVTNVGVYAFSGLSNLTNINIPNSVTIIKTCAFLDCTSLNNVVIPENVESIWAQAFRRCGKLTKLTILSKNITLYNNALLDAYALENVVLCDGFNGTGLNVSASTKFTAEALVSMFEALADLTGQIAHTLTIGATNLAKLTEEQIAIATNKNWTLA